MDTEDAKAKAAWFIDLNWYQTNNRSFTTLAWGCLCPKCRKRLGPITAEISATDIMDAIRTCCSKERGYISVTVPVLESVFRFFLANNNQPTSLEKLSSQLSEKRGGDSQRTSAEVLSRLLSKDQFYGLRQVTV